MFRMISFFSGWFSIRGVGSMKSVKKRVLKDQGVGTGSAGLRPEGDDGTHRLGVVRR